MQSDTFEFTQTPPREQPEVEDPANYRCGNCISCFRVVDCRKCTNCLQNIQPCFRRICIQIGLANKELRPDPDAQQPSYQKDPPRKKGRPCIPKPPKVEKKRGRPLKLDGVKRNPYKPKKPKDPNAVKKSSKKADKFGASGSQGFYVEKESKPRHCYGPGCVRAARQGSKYCSQECGVALAEQRVSVVLPQRLKEYYAEKPSAETKADERLLALIQKRKEVEECLQKANDYRENFDCYIKALADKTPMSNSNPANKKQTTGDLIITCFCFVCGAEIPVSGSVQHTRRCFERLEKQSSFGTAHKVPVNPFQILCETHDKQTKTYCKRLRVVCPEHYKDDIGKQMKICGFPLDWGGKCELKSLDEMLGKDNIFKDGMCSLSRNQCVEHKMWEQNVAALIDNLRMSYLVQIDDLIETYKRIIVATQSHYNGLLHLLSKTTSVDSKSKAEDQQHSIEVDIKEKPTDVRFSDLHLY
ncbi:BUD13-like protein [Aphelenchoides bicaudatus]|nr:BUD13-like protein [Aphelenchoides bicaudatus]